MNPAPCFSFAPVSLFLCIGRCRAITLRRYVSDTSDNLAVLLDARGSTVTELSRYQVRSSRRNIQRAIALQLRCSGAAQSYPVLNAVGSSRGAEVTGIEGFSRRKPVVVRTTPAGAVLPTSLGGVAALTVRSARVS